MLTFAENYFPRDVLAFMHCGPFVSLMFGRIINVPKIADCRIIYLKIVTVEKNDKYAAI